MQKCTYTVRNIWAAFLRTGYIWEQYNDKTGEGQGCKPFTGGAFNTIIIIIIIII